VAAYIFDASALVKGYISELGTAWVNGVLDPTAGNQVRLTSLTAVEVTSAIVRRRRSGSITAAEAATLLADFSDDLANNFVQDEVTPAVFVRARSLAHLHGLRGSDAVQLASTLEIRDQLVALGLTSTFICADDELNGAAKAEGLTVENPNDHP